MRLFLDTEFTDLVIDPRLLSIGLVAASAHDAEFYAEVTDRRRIHAASWVALDVVLPQFGRVAHASCPYAVLGARLCSYMARAVASLVNGDDLEIAFGYDLDWDLAARAMRDGDGKRWAVIEPKMKPRNVYDIVGFGEAKRAAEAYFAEQCEAPLSRHHSLCDARALRVAYQSVNRPSGEAVPTNPLRSTRSI